MPRQSAMPPRTRPSGGERVISDDHGLLWSAFHAMEGGEHLVVFSCISDARRSGRIKSIAAESTINLADVDDDTLKAWLRDAPPIGRLS